MIRGYAPHIWENNLESDKRRDTALLLAAELDDRKVAVVRRLRCALSRLLLESEQVRAVPNPQPSAKRDMAAPSKYGLCLRRRPKKEPLEALFLCAAARRIRGGTPHPPRQARHLPPLGKAKDHFCFHAVCKVLTASVALWELYFRNQTKPSPVGEGGPLAVDEVSRTKAKQAIRESPLRDSGNPLHIAGRRLSPAAFPSPPLSLQYLVKLSYFASVS